MIGRGSALVAVGLMVAFASVGCTDKSATDPSPKASDRAAAQFTAQDRDGRQVHVEVLSLNVVDDLTELRVLITLSVDESATATPEETSLSQLWSYQNYPAVLSDPSHHTAYTAVMESPRDDKLTPGEPYLYQVWFPAPAEDVTELDVTVKLSWPRVLNVPVVRGAPEPDRRALSVSDFDEPDSRTVEVATKAFGLDTRPPLGSVWDFTEHAKVGSLATADEGVVTLSSDILFTSDSADLSQAAEDAVGDLVGDVPSNATVRVDGHTDTVDDDAHNDDLSQRRAQAVADAITAVRPDLKLTVTGHGERNLKVPESGDDIDDDRAQNRRVELTLGSAAPEPAPTPTPVTSSPSRTGTEPTVLPDPADAERLPGAKIEVPVADYPGSTLRIEVEQVKVRGALTQADVIMTLVDPPDRSAAPRGVDLYDIYGSFSPALVDRTNLLRYPELHWHWTEEWKSQGDLWTKLDDGRPHRFRWTFPALVEKTDKVDLVINSETPELVGLPVTYADE